MAVAVNCDMGEGFGLYRMGDDEGLMPHITVANVACGFHASDPVVMHRTVRLAKQHGVAVGAHPSLPDLTDTSPTHTMAPGIGWPCPWMRTFSTTLPAAVPGAPGPPAGVSFFGAASIWAEMISVCR